MTTATTDRKTSRSASLALPRPVRPVRQRTKTLAQEPRGRGCRALSGATETDPLISEIVKIPVSTRDRLSAAAEQLVWHRSVLVREVLIEWLERNGKQVEKWAGQRRRARA